MAFTLQLKPFTTLVQDMSAALQGKSRALVDLTVGSVLRALLESVASVSLWHQYLLVELFKRQRLATSTGIDVDTFVGDFTLVRLPAVAATGAVTLSRFLASSAATVLVGTQVKTGDGTQSYAVTADSSNAYWSASAGTTGGYILPSGTLSITVPVQAVTAGSAANVQAGAINLLGSATANIDSVNNALAFTNGVDAESDDALKARFPNFIGSLSKATPAAVGYAVSQTQAGLSYAITENVDEAGNYMPGHFVVTIDDGTGSPSTNLKSLVYASVDLVRAAGSTFSVQSPILVTPTISMTITAAPGYTKLTLIGIVGAAVTAFVDSLGIGQSLYITKVAQVAYSASPAGVASVTSLLINGSSADLVAGPTTVIRPSSVSVT